MEPIMQECVSALQAEVYSDDGDTGATRTGTQMCFIRRHDALIDHRPTRVIG